MGGGRLWKGVDVSDLWEVFMGLVIGMGVVMGLSMVVVKKEEG